MSDISQLWNEKFKDDAALEGEVHAGVGYYAPNPY
jgi:hypothetical protein